MFASEYDDTPNIWVGIITELRKQPQLKDAEGDQNTSGRCKVWLKVKWAWSGKDLDTLIKSLYVTVLRYTVASSSVLTTILL